MASIRNIGKGNKPWRAEIIKKKGGKIIFRDSATFAKRSDAEQWAIVRESKLVDRETLERAIEKKKDISISDLVDKYIKAEKKVMKWGRTKQADLQSWRDTYPERKAMVSELNDAFLYDFAMRRFHKGVKPATINSNIMALMAVFSSARFLGHKVDVAMHRDVIKHLGKKGLVGPSEKREVRPTVEQMTAIMKSIEASKDSKYWRDTNCPIDKVILFQMFSGRRISETCRILWDDYDAKEGKIFIRDMKNPSGKKLNAWCHLTLEAKTIIDSMPRIDPRIFPYDARSCESGYRQHRDRAGLRTFTDDDLRMHDLRHECFSWLAEKNGLRGQHWDIARIKLVSGHQDLKSLERYMNMTTANPFDKWENWEYRPNNPDLFAQKSRVVEQLFHR